MEMKYIIAALVALTVSLSGRAQAALVTYDFTSVQNGVVGDIPIANGAAFSGSVTVDTATPGTPMGSTTTNYVGALKTINLGGTVIDVSGWATNFVQDTVFHIGGLETGTEFHAVNGSELFNLSLTTTGSMVFFFEMPSSLPALSAFNVAKGLTFADATGFAIDTLASFAAAPAGSVPEPSAHMLFGAALALLGFLSRRQWLACRFYRVNET
jgi:hypothetical protein